MKNLIYILIVLVASLPAFAAASAIDGEVFVAAGTSGTNALPSSRTTNVTISAKSTIANGASAVAFELASSNALSTAGSKLLQLKNSTTNRLIVENDGDIISHDVPPPPLWGVGTNYTFSIWHNPNSGLTTANRIMIGRGNGTNNSEIYGYAESYKAGIDVAVLNSTINARAGSLIVSTNTFQGGLEIYDNSVGIYGVHFKPWADVDDFAFFFSTLREHTSGNILELWDYYTTLKFAVQANGRITTQSAPPANASDTGVAGSITWDANFIYVCVAANTWKRIAIATW
jgi:hypothetical protein